MAIELIDTIKPKNNGSFPIVEAADVLMPDGKRLDEYQFTPGTEGSEEITVTVDVLPETTVTMVADVAEVTETSRFMHLAESGSAVFTALDSLVVGEIYYVEWDGMEYVCAAADGSSFLDFPDEVTINKCVFLGNASFAGTGAENTGEPFAMYILSVSEGEASDALCVFASVPGIVESTYDVIVRIYQTSTTTIQTSSAVPPVSAADNGKLYQVVDGKMAAVALADSAVKTYIDDYINEALGGDY